MLAGLASILSVVAPVFVCAALGFAWARCERPYDRSGVTALISMIGAPCLVFHNLVELDADPARMLQLAGAAVLSVLAFVAIGLVILRAVRLPTHTFLSPLVFGNSGNMGLAISAFAFPGIGVGDGPGLGYGVCYFAVASFLHFTLGVMLWTGRFSLASLVGTPLTWAVALAVLLRVFGWTPPRWILDTTQLLGAFSIPLMLITLGVALSELDLQELPQSLMLSCVRLGMGTAVGFALAWLLDLTGPSRGVLVLQCSMPSAVFNALFAEQFGRSPAQVASLVVTSTLLSFVTLPLVLAAVL